MRTYSSFLVVVAVAAACSDSTSGSGVALPIGEDTLPVPPADVSDVLAPSDVAAGEEAGPTADAGQDSATEEPSTCTGTGCFGDLCTSNDDCQSGYCVWHQGDEVCTRTCISACPEGFACRQDLSAGADLSYVCVSLHPTLCRPCKTDGDCLVDTAVCGANGFCATACSSDVPCPDGFVCEDGHCAGPCECTATAIALGLPALCLAVNDLGTCLGYGVCAEGGVEDCDAAEPAPDQCNGLDDDCDGDTDDVPCDDGDPCTTDVCTAAGCIATPVSGGGCDDGNACTTADTCAAGTCQGSVVTCDDADPCTADSCLPAVGCVAVETNLCACTTDADCPAPKDLCAGKRACVATPYPHCELVEGTAVVCPSPTGPDAPCLAAACDKASGACSLAAANEGAACAVGGGCTVGDACGGGKCVAGAPLACEDGNPCTIDACAPGVGCTHGPTQGPCDDGDACTGSDTCLGVLCKGASLSCDDGDPCTADACSGGCVHTPGALTCLDGNPCTEDICIAGTGCVYTPNGAECDDGNACTASDACTGGWCLGQALSCDDGDPCTLDTCLGGCVHTAGAACDDGNVCTVDGCVVGKGCVFTPTTAACDDGNACTTSDTCAGGWCLGKALSCDDGDPCTLDTCDGGCVHTAGAPCDDGNACTDDACVAGKGCVFTPSSAPCDDGSACTEEDACLGGWCIGAPLACDDGSPCTKDSCSKTAGCVHTAIVGLCDDGDACTANDTCQAGECTSGVTVKCVDGNTCTVDGCDAALGCTFTPVSHCCGNGTKEDAEICDDGGQQGGDGCSGDCMSDETCGNGVLDAATEACDAPKFPAPCFKGAFQCSDSCQTWVKSTCTSWCGDGKLDPKSEQCDGGSFAKACWAGTFTCEKACQYWNTTTCTAWCGDGVKNGPEECDGDDIPAGCAVAGCTCSADCTVKMVEFQSGADWNGGTLAGASTVPSVPLDDACKTGGTVCLDASTTNLASAWIANSGSNEVVKINVDTGVVEKELPCQGTNPSRTAVAKDGSVWVGNRGDTGNLNNGCNSDFSCSNVVHFGADGTFICRADVPGVVRAVAIDAFGNTWAASWRDRKAYKISATEVDKTKSPTRCKILQVVDVVGRAYGAAGDAKGNIWLAHNADWLSSFDSPTQSLQQIDAAKGEVVGTYVPPKTLNACYNNYGITVDGQGRVVIGSYRCYGMFRYTPETDTWEWHAVPEGTPRGVVVDANGYIYTALSCLTVDCWVSGQARHIARISPDFKSHTVVDLGPGIGHPVGVALDHAGRLWSAGRTTDSVARLDITKWGPNAPVTIFPTNGSDPYTYSDMTGFQLLMYTSPEGTWSKVIDSGAAVVTWKSLAWTGKETPGVTDLAVRVRSSFAPSALPLAAWSAWVTDSPMDLTGLPEQGRYLEVQVKLSSTQGGKTPVLEKVVVHWAY